MIVNSPKTATRWDVIGATILGLLGLGFFFVGSSGQARAFLASVANDDIAGVKAVGLACLAALALAATLLGTNAKAVDPGEPPGSRGERAKAAPAAVWESHGH
jgi:hypothetical protein